MFKSFSTFVTTLFTMLNDLALAGGHMAKVAEESAAAFEDEARTTRQVRLIELNKQLKLTAK